MKIKGGAIIPATVVTGRKVVQGPAMRVYNAAASPRLVKGGPSEPVIVVDEDDIVGLGGKYRIMGGPAVPMMNLSNRKVKGGAAIPVYPVDANGAYDSSFAGSYADKVLGYGPIAYWPLWEAAGAVADNIEGTAARDAAYTGVTLGQPGIGDGRTCPFFDGANDFVNLHTASLQAAFNEGEGTVLVWGRVANAAVWTDGVTRYLIRIGVDGNNQVAVLKFGGDDTTRWQYAAGGVALGVLSLISPTIFYCVGITWSKTADEFIGYYNGGQVGAIQNGLGVWAGNISNLFTLVGGFWTGGPEWSGYAAHVAVWDTPLTAPQMLDLATL